MAEKKKGRGCLGTGCLILLGIVALIVLVAAVIGYIVFSNFSELGKLVDEAPQAYEELNFTPEEAKAVQNRIDELSKKAERGEEVDATVSERDLNVLLASNVKGKDDPKLFVDLHPGEITVKFSLPVPDKENTKYYNGVAVANLSIDSGVPHASLRDVKLKGQELPWLFKKILSSVSSKVDEALMQERDKLNFGRFDTLVINEGSIKLHAKSGPPLAQNPEAGEALPPQGESAANTGSEGPVTTSDDEEEEAEE